MNARFDWITGEPHTPCAWCKGDTPLAGEQVCERCIDDADREQSKLAAKHAAAKEARHG